MQKKKLFGGAGVLLLCMALLPLTAFAAEAEAEYTPSMYATFWALVPPIVAIALALITKEVYSSLFYRYSGRRAILFRLLFRDYSYTHF